MYKLETGRCEIDGDGWFGYMEVYYVCNEYGNIDDIDYCVFNFELDAGSEAPGEGELLRLAESFAEYHRDNIAAQEIKFWDQNAELRKEYNRGL